MKSKTNLKKWEHLGTMHRVILEYAKGKTPRAIALELAKNKVELTPQRIAGLLRTADSMKIDTDKFLHWQTLLLRSIQMEALSGGDLPLAISCVPIMLKIFEYKKKYKDEAEGEVKLNMASLAKSYKSLKKEEK